MRITYEDVQRAAEELAILEQAIVDLQARITALNASILDHERALEVIDYLSSNPSELKVLVPIGGGGLVEAEIRFSGRMKVNIGQNVVIEAPVERCREIVSSRKALIERSRSQLVQTLNAYLERAELLRAFLQRVQEAVAAARESGEGGAGVGGG
ncbi:MAG: prefoldin subunit alpha [Nitrososphaerota archaeon]|nr:prefoldin subunit alpha [Candidatus Calditenuis fumarioli]